MKRNWAPEKKTAGAGFVGAVVWLVFELAATYHWFTPPSPAITAAIVTFASTGVAYALPHTHLRPPPLPPPVPAFTWSQGDPGTRTNTEPPPLTAAEAEAIKRRLTAPLDPPASVPPMTSLPPTAAETAAPQPEGNPRHDDPALP